MPVNPATPEEGLLKGQIVVKVAYGADAEARELRLKKTPRGGWSIDPDWVEANGPAGILADDEQRAAAVRTSHQNEREMYRWGSFAAMGFAAASWLGCLIALTASLQAEKHNRLPWACAGAFGCGILAIMLRFVGSPYFPDDDHSYDLRTYAMYGGIIGSGLAGCLWLFGRKQRRSVQS